MSQFHEISVIGRQKDQQANRQTDEQTPIQRFKQYNSPKFVKLVSHISLFPSNDSPYKIMKNRYFI